MDTADLLSQLDQLDDNVDDLEEALEPILGHSLSKLSKNLPVMDKAKLHILITYTLDSLLFSYLRLQGVDTKQHPVFREIRRVQQYFEKIKALETEPEQRNMALDKEAAGRFIKHSLAGNNKIDLEIAEKQAREKAKAQLKATLLTKKAAAQKEYSPSQLQDRSSAAQSSAQSDDDESDHDMGIGTEQRTQRTDPAEEKAKSKKRKKKMKEGKSEDKSKDHKAAKKMRKLDESERKEAKKERRLKKEEIRKVRKAN